jgi:sugar lactone lactonase YvrE
MGAMHRWRLLSTLPPVLALIVCGSTAAAQSLYATMLNEKTVWQFSIVGAGTLAPLVPSNHPIAAAGMMAISPDGRSLYLAEGARIGQYDIGPGGELTPKSPAAAPIIGNTFNVAVSPDGKSVYATDAGGRVWQFDVGPGGTLSAKASPFVGAGTHPEAIAVSPDGRSAYVTDTSTEQVLEFDVGAGGELTPKAATPPATGHDPESIVVTPDGTSVYVGDYGESKNPSAISQYDVAAGGVLTPKTPAKFVAGEGSAYVAISPDGRSLYVSDDTAPEAEAVAQLDIGPGGRLSPKSPEFVKGPFGSTGIAVSPDGRSVYVAASESGSSPGPISEYAVGPGGVLTPRLPAAITAGLYPSTVAITPDQGPIASLTAGAARAGSATTLDGSASHALEGTLADYTWTFGDGTSANGPAASVAHTYSAAGSYPVTLTVTDSAGCSSSLVFTGQTAYCSLDPSAVAAATVVVHPPPVPSAPAGGPRLTGLAQSAARWREGGALAALSRARRVPVGTTYSFTLDTAASVTLTFARRAPGARRGGRCVAKHGHSKGRRCTRFLAAGTLSLSGHAGSDRIRFQGRLSRTRRLVPGAYRVTVVARGAGGLASTPAALTFTILPPR